MRVLVVGLGSMGKRRIRNLTELGVRDIAGFDVRSDRVAEATARYGIAPYLDFQVALDEFYPEALVISTDPQHHMQYAYAGLDLRLPCFIEASVVDAERIRELHIRSTEAGVLMAPSCTMRYFPGPRAVKRLLGEGTIGAPLTLTYHTGQWLEDWHPWETIQDFYVSRRNTGGCREIVPFELTWLDDLFGQPQPLSCVRRKLSNLPADIDDLYQFVLQYPAGLLASITVEVLSRPHAVRELRIVGSAGTIVYSADQNVVRFSTLSDVEWIDLPLVVGEIADGYVNPEEPYVAEMASFIAAVEAHDSSLFPNTLASDFEVLRILGELDAIADTR